MEQIRIITKGRDLRKIGAKAFMDYINPFVKEKSFIALNKPVTLKGEKEWLSRNAKDIDKKDKIFVILFIDKKIAGTCTVWRDNLQVRRHNITFAISVAKKYRGKGYGKMLLKKTMQIAKKKLKPKKMWIEHIEGNKIARKLYQELGFVQVARFNDYVNHFGRYKDQIIMEYKGK
ncbi:MAG: GNAT family N-acetyltransferase [Candidatus Micrarchaeota archaeon]